MTEKLTTQFNLDLETNKHWYEVTNYSGFNVDGKKYSTKIEAEKAILKLKKDEKK